VEAPLLAMPPRVSLYGGCARKTPTIAP